ncbi:replication initiation protein [Arcicella rigui]|uniref:Replication initiation protein n=1 Tax=Arcicella rigui TaxID=797020 RepID=A0ABU5QGB8_9BACT|nr:replication initiation protein [Arcicella rigui]MEA5141677.1 replication initiation protein [Arcicella rigui]
MKQQKKPTIVESDITVAQHNELVKARFNMSLMETRLFIALLGRINKGDTDFSLCRIPISEVSSNVDGGKAYQDVKEAVIKLSSKVITVETVDQNGKREIISDPLMATCRYKDGSGFIVAQLNSFVKPYLLQLKGNFTVAEIKVLLQLRSYYSYRIYWLLKSFSYNSNTFSIKVEDLKTMMGIEGQYPNFYDFKKWVLLVSQRELTQTDMAFSFNEIKEGRSVKQVEFIINRQLSLPMEEELNLPNHLQSLLSEIGVSLNSMQEISEMLNSGKIDQDYIYFVIKELKDKKSKGSIKSLSGAIYSAITKQHLMEAYLSEKNQKIYKQPVTTQKKEESKPVVKLKLKEQEEGFAAMLKRKVAPAKDFTTYLASLMAEGFRIELINGEEYLIKD